MLVYLCIAANYVVSLYEMYRIIARFAQSARKQYKDVKIYLCNLTQLQT